ncbi:hypothetical protein EIP91_009992 [Steccherinum ochraceum]|uniref:Uncharacterized protein n=1 Tax=Steccherinum ochraceum TaxID=92696 RepID=A0A4R0RX82_9APHY|nr:hypothetical protein EIP91_009992 [Steccherinum ochraceum]
MSLPKSPPIFALPIELLAETFLCAIDELEAFDPFMIIEPDSRRPYDTLTSVVNFSLVCKYFRNIALHTPLLWKDIYLASDVPLWLVDLMLDRSGQMPLRVRVTTATDPRLLEPAVHRISSLSCLCFGDISGRGVVYDMPLLQELFVDSYHSKLLPGVPFISHQDLLPQLRRLSLIEVPFLHAQALFRPTLIDLCYYLEVNAPPLSELMRALGEMHTLERLELSISGSEELFLTEAVPKATLPYLKRLNLPGDPNSCAAILRSLVFPATTFLNSFSYEGEEIEGTYLFSSVLSKLSGHGLLGAVPRADELILEASSALDPIIFSIRAISNGECFFWQSFDGLLQVHDALDSLCCLPHTDFLSGIQSLVFETLDNFIDEIPSFPRTSITSRLTNLTALHLNRAPTLRYSLAKFHLSLRSPTAENLPFPKLRVLSLTDAEFRAEPPSVVIGHRGSDFIWYLRDMLAIRQDAGIPLQELNIWSPINFNGSEDEDILRRHVKGTVSISASEESGPAQVSEA